MIDKAPLPDASKSTLSEGDALVLALTRRFRTSIQEADVDGRVFSILKPANSDDLIREKIS
jgi:hypothetical protein